MISERQQTRLLNWFKDNYKVAFLLVSLAGNVFIFKTLVDERKRFDVFYQEVYHTEVERSKTWENIILKSKSR